MPDRITVPAGAGDTPCAAHGGKANCENVRNICVEIRNFTQRSERGAVTSIPACRVIEETGVTLSVGPKTLQATGKHRPDFRIRIVSAKLQHWITDRKRHRSQARRHCLQASGGRESAGFPQDAANPGLRRRLTSMI